MDMASVNSIVSQIDSIVWGPLMLLLLVGTGVYLTCTVHFRTWRNLPYALHSVLSKEARQKKGTGDVSPFSALCTALAATIGTGNIVGVATAMFAGGPGALVWMWISACFGLTSKFSECMLAIKYREHRDLHSFPTRRSSDLVPRSERTGRNERRPDVHHEKRLQE